jgi:putative Mn2+ efflux pump MntP
MLALLVVAASLGMSNFAAAISIGVAGVDSRTRLRVGLVFGAFESGMPLLGLLLGQQVADPLGHAARWIAAGLLIAVGAYGLATGVHAARGRSAGEPAKPGDPGQLGSPGQPAGPGQPAPFGRAKLLMSGFALSLDNLAVGFALGAYGTSIVTSAIVIGVVSVVLSLIGLELGSVLGSRVGERGEQLAGVMLISVGIAIAAGALS